MKWYLWLICIWFLPFWTILAVYFKVMFKLFIHAMELFVFGAKKVLELIRKTFDWISKKYHAWRQEQ